MCDSAGRRSEHQRTSYVPRSGGLTAAPDPVDPPGARVGDAERERTAATVSDAAAEGYLGMGELDERLSAVWSARTRRELEEVVADLPAAWIRERSRREGGLRTSRQARSTMASQLWSYLSVMALLVAIWLAVGVAAGAWHPWPIWPALGWGLGLLGRARAARAYDLKAKCPIPPLDGRLRQF